MRAQAGAHGRKSCRARAGDIAKILRRSYSCGSPPLHISYNMPMHHSQSDGCAAWVGWVERSATHQNYATQHINHNRISAMLLCDVALVRREHNQMMSCTSRIARRHLRHAPGVPDFTSLAASPALCGRFVQRCPTNELKVKIFTRCDTA